MPFVYSYIQNILYKVSDFPSFARLCRHITTIQTTVYEGRKSLQRKCSSFSIFLDAMAIRHSAIVERKLGADYALALINSQVWQLITIGPIEMLVQC